MTIPRVLLQHPLGNEFSRALIRGLCETGALARFNTGIASFPNNFIGLISQLPGLGELKRRSFPPEAASHTKQFPARELARLLCNRFGIQAFIRHETGVFSVDRVYQHLDKISARHIQDGRFNAVYCYEDGALSTFKTVKDKNLSVTCFYDLPIGYWREARRIQLAEVERWPEWQSTMPAFLDSDEKLQRKDEELKLADKIFVASSFTKETLNTCPFPISPIEVIPYGFPEPGLEKDYKDLDKRKLKVLYVGGLTQRKGIADVFAVCEKLKQDVQLTVIGKGKLKECDPLRIALDKVNWIESLPNQEVIRTMRDHDVLLFPSLFEGFGMVITEAMSQGTPVITTHRTAGADLIQHDHNGWLVEAANTNALQQQIEVILGNPELIRECGENARQSAFDRPWSTYGREMANAIASSIASNDEN